MGHLLGQAGKAERFLTVTGNCPIRERKEGFVVMVCPQATVKLSGVGQKNYTIICWGNDIKILPRIMGCLSNIVI